MESSHDAGGMKGFPPLAGLCSMERAIQGGWSVEASVTRLKRLHFIWKRLAEVLTSRITGEPIYELKTAYSYHAYLCVEQASLLRQRVGEMREPPLGLEVVPHIGLAQCLDELQHIPDSVGFAAGYFQVLVPALEQALNELLELAHPLADAPTVRAVKMMQMDLQTMREFGTRAMVACHDSELMISLLGSEATEMESHTEWLQELEHCLRAAGGVGGNLPAAQAAESEFPKRRYQAGSTATERMPKRDLRFKDSYNAGVNPEAFLYDERYSARAKTLMVYYKRLREIDVPEMMATILVDLQREEPWEFYREMSRQLWDEARHAMMGEVGFVAQGIDWCKIPINFTWSRNLNLQLNARERHGVLFFIEQGLMPRSGKRYEWEVGLASGDPLSGLFQDFDWADEVLHAQIGRRWYVPRYGSLQEALQYGDRSWSQVLSHWSAYREQGLTEHRNWWPDLYREACQKWGVEPNPLELAFAVTYEEQRADLKKL